MDRKSILRLLDEFDNAISDEPARKLVAELFREDELSLKILITRSEIALMSAYEHLKQLQQYGFVKRDDDSIPLIYSLTGRTKRILYCLQRYGDIQGKDFDGFVRCVQKYDELAEFLGENDGYLRKLFDDIYEAVFFTEKSFQTIDELLLNEGLSQRQISERVGISRSAVDRYLKSFENIRLVQRVGGKPKIYYLTGEGAGILDGIKMYHLSGRLPEGFDRVMSDYMQTLEKADVLQ